MNPSDTLPSATEVALRDRQLSGWCNRETGELVSDVVVKPGMQVVDVGCGDGGYITFCARRGANVTFVDLNGDKVGALEQRLLAEESGGVVKGLVSDCNPIPVPDGHADLVISTEVLEHVPDPMHFLREIVRVGGADATWVLTVPDARSENLLQGIAPPQYFSEPNHIHIFSSDEFEEMARSCGLEIIRHDYMSSFWSIFYLLKWATTLPGESLTENVQPQTTSWTQTWESVLNHPQGDKIRTALNNALPRTQMIVAKRQGANRS